MRLQPIKLITTVLGISVALFCLLYKELVSCLKIWLNGC